MFHLLQFATVFHYNIVTKSRKKNCSAVCTRVFVKGQRERERENTKRERKSKGKKSIFATRFVLASSIPLVIRDPQRTRESRENVCIRIVLPSIAPTPRPSPSIFLRCVNVICPLKHLLYDYSSLKGSSTAFQHFYPPERGHNRFLYLDPRG